MGPRIPASAVLARRLSRGCSGPALVVPVSMPVMGISSAELAPLACPGPETVRALFFYLKCLSDAVRRRRTVGETMTSQMPLIVEDLPTALGDVARALGGFKRTGALLRPELPADQAGRWFSDCLNPAQREKLSPDQMVMLLREGRRVGCHSAMAFLAQECGYAPPQPIEPADEAAELQRQFLASVVLLQQIERRLSALGRTTMARAA